MQLNINGRSVEVEAGGLRTLVDVLRYDLGYTGTKEACGVGVCGACTVLVDGRMVASCITLAAQAAGAQVQTIEGLGDREILDPLQESFIRDGGFQCGICTPGQLLAAKSLLAHNPAPTEDEIKDWMMGNLCRCTGYYQIVESIANAANTANAQGRDA
ncbi:MAG: (2Fe-2S)-binding protein [Chloroflexota bacterium]